MSQIGKASWVESSIACNCSTYAASLVLLILIEMGYFIAKAVVFPKAQHTCLDAQILISFPNLAGHRHIELSERTSDCSISNTPPF